MANCSPPMALSHEAIGADSFQCVTLRPSPVIVSLCNRPFATTEYFCGAVIINSFVAFADGWSIIGNQSRALFGQFHEKKHRSLYLFTPTLSPSAGSP